MLTSVLFLDATKYQSKISWAAGGCTIWVLMHFCPNFKVPTTLTCEIVFDHQLGCLIWSWKRCCGLKGAVYAVLCHHKNAAVLWIDAVSVARNSSWAAWCTQLVIMISEPTNISWSYAGVSQKLLCWVQLALVLTAIKKVLLDHLPCSKSWACMNCALEILFHVCACAQHAVLTTTPACLNPAPWSKFFAKKAPRSKRREVLTVCLYIYIHGCCILLVVALVNSVAGILDRNYDIGECTGTCFPPVDVISLFHNS